MSQNEVSSPFTRLLDDGSTLYLNHLAHLVEAQTGSVLMHLRCDGIHDKTRFEADQFNQETFDRLVNEYLNSY